jgi:hypothetical protein
MREDAEQIRQITEAKKDAKEMRKALWEYYYLRLIPYIGSFKNLPRRL